VSAGTAPKRRLDPIVPVLAVVAVGVLTAALHHPQAGMYVAAAGLAAGAVLRILLSPRNAGSLVVRRKQIDVIVLGGLALGLAILAAVTPFPSG